MVVVGGDAGEGLKMPDVAGGGAGEGSTIQDGADEQGKKKKKKKLRTTLAPAPLSTADGCGADVSGDGLRRPGAAGVGSDGDMTMPDGVADVGLKMPDGAGGAAMT